MRVCIFSSLLLLLLISCQLSYADQSDNLYRKYLRTVGSNDYPRNADVTWITPEVKELLIQKAQAAARDLNPDVNFGSKMALIELGDPTTIDAYMAEYH